MLVMRNMHKRGEIKNSCNGYISKKISSVSGVFEVKTPRDRDSEFEPQIVKKGQRRLLGFDQKILTLYAKGQSTRDISNTLKGKRQIIPVLKII